MRTVQADAPASAGAFAIELRTWFSGSSPWPGAHGPQVGGSTGNTVIVGMPPGGVPVPVRSNDQATSAPADETE